MHGFSHPRDALVTLVVHHLREQGLRISRELNREGSDQRAYVHFSFWITLVPEVGSISHARDKSRAISR